MTHSILLDYKIDCIVRIDLHSQAFAIYLFPFNYANLISEIEIDTNNSFQDNTLLFSKEKNE